MSEPVKLTEAQTELARHALGLPNKRRQSYRNHYVVGEGSDDFDAWTAMVEAGAARRRKGSPLTGGDDLFWLTEAGAKAALKRGEGLWPEDFPAGRQALSPNQGGEK